MCVTGERKPKGQVSRALAHSNRERKPRGQVPEDVRLAAATTGRVPLPPLAATEYGWAAGNWWAKEEGD